MTDLLACSGLGDSGRFLERRGFRQKGGEQLREGECGVAAKGGRLAFGKSLRAELSGEKVFCEGAAYAEPVSRAVGGWPFEVGAHRKCLRKIVGAMELMVPPAGRS